MATKVVGNINIGLIFGLLQFVSTFAITALYVRFANRKLDPIADRIARRTGRGAVADHPRPEPPSGSNPSSTSPSSRCSSSSRWSSCSARQPQHQDGLGLLRRRAAPSPDRRTASPSPATTCRRRRSSASPGAIAVYGYDGFLYSIGFLVAWLVALLLVAELLRNTGKFTMADVLAFRMKAAPGADRRGDRPRWWSRSSTCSPRWPARAGSSRCCWASTAIGRPSSSRSSASLMILYVLVGGMKGTTWVQIIKAALLIAGAVRHDRVGARPATASTSPSCSGDAVEHGPGPAIAAEPGREVRRQRDLPSSTSSRSASRWCSAPPACRTC